MSNIYISDNYPYSTGGCLCHCENCGENVAWDELKIIQDAEQRLTPGEETPAGECPHCYALVYVPRSVSVPKNPIKEGLNCSEEREECPHCGYENDADAITCDICETLLIDRRRTEAAKGLAARPNCDHAGYMAARAKLIEQIAETRTDQTEPDEMHDLARHLTEQRLNRDNDKSLLEEAEFLEMHVDHEIKEALK